MLHKLPFPNLPNIDPVLRLQIRYFEYAETNTFMITVNVPQRFANSVDGHGDPIYTVIMHAGPEARESEMFASGAANAVLAMLADRVLQANGETPDISYD